ncbi:hypothetical protein KOI35_39510 [Actinoplanes bogorensis]|uniref:Uncharacterized protein n=1 Tax=Paractinoplanes bogorensis TaxID=1610840 RepID=A0ABS5Z267_9ACTN|nr:hypothetical protein [Actinoplanes bogorensis]MBU2669616.1 hypothetical protein [Actinoplanes bogorensis]
MNDEQELRQRLEAITPPPSRWEAESLLEAGRRQVFRRRSWQAAGGVAVATGAVLAVPGLMRSPEPVPLPAASPAEPPGCTTRVLATPTGVTGASAAGVDPTGRFVIGLYAEGQDFHSILWTDGKPKALPQQAESIEATAVNAQGVVAGLATNGAEQYAFRYENGKYTRMRTPPGQWTVYPGPAMNATGDIVINAEPIANIEGKDSIALLWKAGTTTAVKLPLPPEANIYDISDTGPVVGATFKNGQGDFPYVWQRTGSGKRLTIPDGTRAIAHAIRGDWAAGGIWPATGEGKPALWNLRTGQFTQLPGNGPADDVNSTGVVVAAGQVIRDGKPVKLPVPAGEEASARAVSDTGLVVGHTQGRNDDERGDPRVWQC